jgi:signal transduction histidine kinase
MNYEPEILNLSFELNKALQPLDDIFGNKEIRLEINVDEVHLAYCDPIMLGLLLTNLLTNAVKFSHRGGKVEINSTNEGTGTVVEVKDSGVGIGKAEIEKLFRIEIQYSTEGTEGERGSGLGLILGRKIIDKNRGKIWVESELGKGSSFKFMLPDKPAEYKT